MTKLLCLLFSYLPPFLADQPLALLPYAGLLVAAALAVGAGPHLRATWRLMLVLFGMSLLLWSFFHPGTVPLLQLGPLTIARESFAYGIATGLRLCCFIAASLAFLTCTPIEAVTYGLTRLGMPYAASFALSLAFRLTPLFLETGQQIALAQRARGLDLDRGGPLRRLRSYLPIIVPVLLGGLRRADQLAVALEMRGFGRRGSRTTLVEYRVTWRDGVLLLGILLAGAGSYWLDLKSGLP